VRSCPLPLPSAAGKRALNHSPAAKNYSAAGTLSHAWKNRRPGHAVRGGGNGARCCAAMGKPKKPERSRFFGFGYARGVNLQEIIAALDREIARLEQVRRLLAQGEGNTPARGKRGRPAKKTAAGSRPKRKLSPEARARIVEAQKRRWAAKKKAANKNAAAQAKTAE
jgi:hypothetical protein